MWVLYVAIALAVIAGIFILCKKYVFREEKNTEQRRQRRTATDIKGDFGEWYVKHVLGKTIEGKKYVINDYIIETNGKSTEIDHILINTHGVFVIETKNRAGEIYGDDDADEWVQILGNGNVKNTFRNPVKQNAAHVAKIQKFLKNAPIYSVVVFIKNNTDNIQSKHVVPVRDLEQALNSGEHLLSAEQMEKIYEVLINHRSNITKEEHKRRIQQQNYDMMYNHICPSCGSNLEVRNYDDGKHLECTNPRCRFAKNIEK